MSQPVRVLTALYEHNDRLGLKVILTDDGTIRYGKELPQPDQDGLCMGLENMVPRQPRCQVNRIPTLTAVVILQGRYDPRLHPKEQRPIQWSAGDSVVRKGHGRCSGLPDPSSCFVSLPCGFLWCVYAEQAIRGFRLGEAE